MIDQFIAKIGDLFINYIHWPYLAMCIVVTWLVFYLMPTTPKLMSKRVKVGISMGVSFLMALFFIGGYYFFDKTEAPSLFTQRLALSFFCVPFLYNWLVEPWLGKWERQLLNN